MFFHCADTVTRDSSTTAGVPVTTEIELSSFRCIFLHTSESAQTLRDRKASNDKFDGEVAVQLDSLPEIETGLRSALFH